ncbi:hypothetical protein RISK_006705 [Rhodopirellula islandica]|uniref:Uncharacterized protein n=1 Tax=Rhodopirellula islandica TaxID=595434 RepID=A0A0J1B3T5_RHOIS|nr:hypothetical protein RISK_006705 [Rhodopirellula islandica]
MLGLDMKPQRIRNAPLRCFAVGIDRGDLTGELAGATLVDCEAASPNERFTI